MQCDAMDITDVLSEKIADELRDAMSYTKMAAAYHDKRPELSRTLHEIAQQELEHMRRLHDAAVEIIDECLK